MRLIQIPVMQLRPGMFVAELDRPWLETPFALQGFMVRDDEEVLYIAQYADHVYVDPDYGGSPQYLPLQLLDRQKLTQKLNIKAEFQQSKLTFQSAAKTLDSVFASLRKGEHTDVGVVRKAVNPLIDGVFRNKEAVAALVRLKEAGSYLYNHGIAMAVWAAILGRHIGLHRDELEKLVIGCAMCDIGMTNVPRQVLENSKPLNAEQNTIIRQHPLIGAKMVSNSEMVDIEILAIIENHHERYDGSGYPRHLEGAAIPLLARIAGLVDCYDAMLTPRSYAKARSSFEAVQELIENKDKLFQGTLVEQFIQAIGLFPTGAMVELNTDEVAIVVKQNSLRRLKPEVVVVLDSHKQPKDVLELVDLAEQKGGLERWISRELQRGAYGINHEDFFL